MADALIFIEALSLAVFALATFAFTISSIWEKERRAAFIGGVTFCILLGSEIGLFALKTAGFFQSIPGILILLVGLAIPVAALLLLIRTGRNPRLCKVRKVTLSEKSRGLMKETKFSPGIALFHPVRSNIGRFTVNIRNGRSTTPEEGRGEGLWGSRG